MQAFSAYSEVGPNGVRYWPNDDDYISIAFALFEQAAGEVHGSITKSTLTRARSWFAPKQNDFSTFATWNYDGENLL